MDSEGNPIQIVDFDGNPVYECCYSYDLKDDDCSADLRAGCFSLRATLSRLPAGWGFCSLDKPAHQGWLWAMSGWINGGFGDSIFVHSQQATSQYFVWESGRYSVDEENILTRTLTSTTSSLTSTRDFPVLNATNVPLCGPDPSTQSGQGWRTYEIPAHHLPAISREQ